MNRNNGPLHKLSNTVGFVRVPRAHAAANPITAQRQQTEGTGFAAGSADHVEGNWIGPDVTGLAALGNGTGVLITGNGLTFGETGDRAANLISGNTTIGISVTGQNDVVQGSWVGLDATGAGPLGNGVGILIGAASRRSALRRQP